MAAPALVDTHLHSRLSWRRRRVAGHCRGEVRGDGARWRAHLALPRSARCVRRSAHRLSDAPPTRKGGAWRTPISAFASAPHRFVSDRPIGAPSARRPSVVAPPIRPARTAPSCLTLRSRGGCLPHRQDDARGDDGQVTPPPPRAPLSVSNAAARPRGASSSAVWLDPPAVDHLRRRGRYRAEGGSRRLRDSKAARLRRCGAMNAMIAPPVCFWFWMGGLGARRRPPGRCACFACCGERLGIKKKSYRSPARPAGATLAARNTRQRSSPWW